MGSVLTSLWRLFTNKWRNVPLPPANTFAGKTIIVTGSNTGLGKEAARHFANLGAAKVILAVRTPSKGEAAKADLESWTGRKVFEVWPLDMEEYASITAFAARARALERLDVLALNAGIASGKFALSKEGNEMQTQVNGISTALLGLLLLPKLVEMRRKFPDSVPHMTFTGSEVHEEATFVERKEPSIIAACNDPRFFSESIERYNVAKLFNHWVAVEIARLVPPVDKNTSLPAVVVDIVAPGFCKSELIKDDAKVLIFIQNTFGRSTTDGGKIIVDGAIQAEHAHGKYIYNCKVTKPGYFVYSEEGKKQMERWWKETLDILVNVVPEVKEIARV